VQRPAVVVGLGVVGLVAVIAPSQLAPRTVTVTSEQTTHPLVLVGVAGLRWEDVGALATPALWELSRDAAVGQVAVRSVESRACPVDGWLAVSSGARMAWTQVKGRCLTVPEPVGGPTSATVALWGEVQRVATDQGFAATPGVLGDEVRDQHVTATAVGPGAALALADADGAVAGTYHPRPQAAAGLTPLVAGALESGSLVVVDAGVIRETGHETTDLVPELVGQAVVARGERFEPQRANVPRPDRAAQVQAVDERIGAVVAAAKGTGATVMVVSLADSGGFSLRLAAVAGPMPGTDEPARGLLVSPSTRQVGVVQATDLLPTVLWALGVDGGSGSVITAVPGPGTAAERVFLLQDTNRHAVQITRVSGLATDRLMNALKVLAVVAVVFLTRAAHRSSGRVEDEVRRWGLPTLRVAAVFIAAVPVSAYLTSAWPWWQSATPYGAFWTTMLGCALAITAVAFAGPWRRSRVGPVAVVAAVTTVVLTADAALGGRLVVDSPFGAHRILAARFYGTSNQGFALLTVAALIFAAVVARSLLARGRRTAAWLSVAMVGVVVTAADGLPGLGSDFGGPPAMIPAFMVLALVVAGRRVRWPWVLGGVAAVAAVVVGFAWADYARPPASRTHLGRFVQTFLDGGMWPVVQRKLEANLRMLGKARYTVPTVFASAMTLWLADLPGRWRWPARPRGTMADLFTAEPLLRPAVAAVTVALGLGFALNDSGIVIPATALALAAPLLVALVAAWLAEDNGDGSCVLPGQDDAVVAASS